MWWEGGGCDVIFNITEGGLELIFFVLEGGYCLSFCYITLVFYCTVPKLGKGN